jgi:hypothetical protein
MNKIHGIIQTRPSLTLEIYTDIEAKVALSWVRTNNPVVKTAMHALKTYILQTHEWKKFASI